MAKHDLAIPFPCNLICDVFGCEVSIDELPPDIDESVEFVLENMMPERDAFILILRYLHNMKIREIAVYYGLSTGRIHQIIRKAQRRLRHPSCSKYLQDGCAKVELEESAAVETQVQIVPPVDPRPKEAITDITDAHVRIDVIMARGGLNQIKWLDLPVRAYNCLTLRQVESVWQLCLLTPATLLQFRNLGAGTLAAIQERLSEHDLVLDDGTIGNDSQVRDYAEQRYTALAVGQ